MEGKQTRGRQKIEMKRIEKQDDRYASFSKRKIGIYKKASDMCTSCKIDVGIIIFSPTCKAYSFFNPNEETVINRFFKKSLQHHPAAAIIDSTDQLVQAHVQANIDQINKQLDELEIQKEIEEQRAKKLNEISAPSDKFAWLDKPFEELDMDSINNLQLWIDNVLNQLANHLKELNNGGSSSGSPPSDDFFEFVF